MDGRRSYVSLTAVKPVAANARGIARKRDPRLGIRGRAGRCPLCQRRLGFAVESRRGEGPAYAVKERRARPNGTAGGPLCARESNASMSAESVSRPGGNARATVGGQSVLREVVNGGRPDFIVIGASPASPTPERTAAVPRSYGLCLPRRPRPDSATCSRHCR